MPLPAGDASQQAHADDGARWACTARRAATRTCCVRRVDHGTTGRYAELYDWLEPGRAARRAAAGRWAADWARGRPRHASRHARPEDDRMTTVAELIVEALADHGVTHGLGRRRRRAQPGHRRDPARGPHRVDRGAPRGGRRVRRQRAGAADRHARRLHGHGRARARSTCSTACTTRRSRTPRCSRSAGRCRGRDRQRLLPGGRQRRCCSRDVAVFTPHRHRAPSSCRTLLEQAVQRGARTSSGVAVLTLPGDVGGLDLPQGTPPRPRSSTAPAAACRRRRRARRGGRR